MDVTVARFVPVMLPTAHRVFSSHDLRAGTVQRSQGQQPSADYTWTGRQVYTLFYLRSK